MATKIGNRALAADAVTATNIAASAAPANWRLVIRAYA